MRKYYSYKESHRTVKGVKQKRCTMCKKWKEEREFHKDRARTDGLKIRCKDCERVYQHKLAGKDGINIGRRLKFEQRHRTLRGVKQKLCSCCERWKDESQYHRNTNSNDRLHTHCKKCCNEYARKRYEPRRKEERHRVVKSVRKKLCTKCRRWKKESHFYKCRSAKDGLTARCKKCSYKATGKSRKK